MMFRRKQREVPELNTTSTADISFMLLVFFLVTSSMDADRGLSHRLPPPDEQQQEQKDINRSNVLQIRIDANDAVFCDDEPVSHQQLQQTVASFVASRQTDNHTIVVETDREATYNAYFEMQNDIMAAYHSIRETMARQKYGCALSQCTSTEREAIMRRYPLRVSESMTEGGSR